MARATVASHGSRSRSPKRQDGTYPESNRPLKDLVTNTIATMRSANKPAATPTGPHTLRRPDPIKPRKRRRRGTPRGSSRFAIVEKTPSASRRRDTHKGG